MTPATWGSKRKVKVKKLRMTSASLQCGLLLLSTVTLIVSGTSHLLPQFKTSSRWFRQMKYNTMKRDFLSSVFAHLFSFSLNSNSFNISIKAQIRTGTTKTFFISLQSDLWCKVLKRVINERKWSRINVVAELRKYFYFCWQIMSDSC